VLVNADVSAVVGFGSAALVTAAVTPVAIRVARRTGFLDHPREYRKHDAATPFLGGAAVMAGFLVAAVAVGGVDGKHILLASAVGMWMLGTLDDKFAVAPVWRLLAEALAAAALIAAHLSWQTSLGPIVNVVLTIVWIAGIVNAFNLMDNLDGACSTVGCVCATGIGTFAAIHGLVAIAGLSFAMAGACAGFLPWNLAGPAKIFLGDGGSMPIGFLLAALSMGAARSVINTDDSLVAGGILAGALLAGLPILDTALVSISRVRRGVSLVTGGRDHLTHRLLRVLGSPPAVAAALGAIQAFLCTLAIVGDQLGVVALTSLAGAAVLLGVIAIAALDSPKWRPAGIASGQRTEPAVAPTVRRGVQHTPVQRQSVGVDSG
jgi:UDP-GlcNAc:undecaprenyl-phosphate/decaprenyl-phosphate GlcNAc-1-phosphate transferase